MKAQGLVKVGRWVAIGALVLALLPGAVLAQWTLTGDASVEGKLGVGTQDPARGFHLQSHSGIFRIDRDADPTAFMLARTAPGDFDTIWKTFLFGVKASGVDDGEFTIRDMGAQVSGVVSSRRLTIANNGRFAFGDVATPTAGLHIRNPVAGDILRLDTVAGTEVFSVEDDGDLYARGADLELRLSDTSPDGYDLGAMSTLLANTTAGLGGEAFVSLSEDGISVCSPGNTDLFTIIDRDSYATNYIFDDQFIEMREPADITIKATRQGNAQELILSTTGEEIWFISDSDNNTVQAAAFSWMCNGSTTADKHMDLVAGTGQLRTKGPMTPNHSFDLAEAYWRSEAGIEAGDVVRIDPEQPNAVVLARSAGDRAVVGVVSTDPGIVMGGGAFTAEHLEDLWGEEVAVRFARGRKKIAADVSAKDPYIKERLTNVSKMKKALAKGGKRGEADRAAKDYKQEQQQLADAVENAALEAFCTENLAQVALAGRVPVKVDASYGAIQIGDALVASATPGHAMRSDNPGVCTVVGKALEAYVSGQGTIMMMVLNR